MSSAVKTNRSIDWRCQMSFSTQKGHKRPAHYGGVIMGAMASQITSLAIVYSTVYSGSDQRKHQSSASLAFVRWPVNSLHKMASNAEKVSIWWRNHESLLCSYAIGEQLPMKLKCKSTENESANIIYLTYEALNMLGNYTLKTKSPFPLPGDTVPRTSAGI